MEAEVSEVRKALYRGDRHAAQNGGWTRLDEAIITKDEWPAALLREHGGRVSGNALPD